MEISPPLEQGSLVKRYKRFFTDIRLNDQSIFTVHCPNTGSMKNCLSVQQPCWYSLSDNPKRKLPGTLEITTSPLGAKVGVNTHRANHLVEEAVSNGVIEELQGYSKLRREVRYGNENSRIDLLLEDGDRRCYVEVKNVTLETDGFRMQFPDAVTSRGTKHLRELMTIVDEGYRAVLFFCVQHDKSADVSPAWEIDPEYCKTLEQAVHHGVEVLAYRCCVGADEIAISQAVPFSL